MDPREWMAAHEIADRLPRMELTGDRRLVIENHRGVTEYGDTCVRIDCGARQVRVVGTELQLTALSLTEAVLEGYITAIELTGG